MADAEYAPLIAFPEKSLNREGGKTVSGIQSIFAEEFITINPSWGSMNLSFQPNLLFMLSQFALQSICVEMSSNEKVGTIVGRRAWKS